MFQNYFPHELRGPIKRYSQKIINFFNPYIHVTFQEYAGDGFSRSSAFTSIERYLNANSTNQAKNLKANVARDSEVIVLSMAKNEEVTEEYEGIKLWWTSRETEDEKRYFRLTFHRKHRQTITTKYLTHILSEGKAITVKERRRKLYTNNKNDGGYRRSMWSHVLFEHPATFNTLAMEPEKKQDIINDLLHFANSKDYYAKIGKAWKRGYLLFGPPGTGKSTMIAAMANLLKYDVYDVELTSVKDNTELRKLLIDTSNKSIIVIEDIDCSLDLTGQREKKKNEENDDKDGDKEKDEEKDKVTLSGLLNFIDGLWSACGGERIIVFTTNYVEKLDPALIRRGRMDKHIELSYCGFEAFKVLAKNYLDIEEHNLFGTVRRMLDETEMTPADVAENLMPKMGGEDAESCLVRLIKALEEAKKQARIKAEEEEKLKAEKLAKEEEEKKKKEKEDKSGGDNQELDNKVKENGEANDKTENSENGIKENGVATK
ncbi:probable mitochondrial chaperone bcs1-b [Phtheirospermum japonicum]|uniref:Probable mitochondrial chaperone bcs1-b n=1 Tax=Phtheirospermum japonicum TaxID=374723 RepID=A0A830CT51_9LAMI|nr:probable mitochondrial chaperone bcs1-b [Phtheirospermum japonicum]